MKINIPSFTTVGLLLAFSLVLSVSGFGQEYDFVLKWGELGSGDGQLNFPTGIAVDIDGYIYVADHYNNRIQKFDSDGNFITKWGSLGSEDGQFQFPTAIAVNSDGIVYVLDHNRVQKFETADGINYAYVSQWGSPGFGDGEFNSPLFLAVDSDGYVYVADESNFRVQKFDSNGNFVTKWGSLGSGDGEFGAATGLAVDTDNNVYVSDTVNDCVQKFGPNGNYISKWGNSGSGDGEFISLGGIAVDSEGSVYVPDGSINRIQKFDSNGNFISKWGNFGSGDGEFNIILDVSVDSDGNVYAADARNNRIQKFARYNTLPGKNVSVNLEDPETGEAPVSMMFEEVTEGGETTLVISNTGPAPATGFKLSDPAIFYEIETSASFSGFITICIDYSGVNIGDEDNLIFSHYEEGMWVDIPIISHDKNTDVICGQVASLSTFALFEPMELEDLIQVVEASGVHSGIRISLVKKLQNAQKSLDKGNIIEAIDQIIDFQNEVRAQSGKKIPSELADEWIEISEIILASL